jgi:hypothetical protein
MGAIMSTALGANNKEEGVSDSLGLLRQVEVPPVGDAADVYRAVWALPDRRAPRLHARHRLSLLLRFENHNRGAEIPHAGCRSAAQQQLRRRALARCRLHVYRLSHMRACAHMSQLGRTAGACEPRGVARRS